MPILERYRRPRGRRSFRTLRRVVVLAAMLLVLISFMSRGRDRVKPITPRAERSTPVEPAKSVPVKKGPPAEWKSLSEDEEHTLLAGVQDQVPLTQREHREAYFYLLNKVHRMSDADLTRLLDADVTYRDFAKQPAIVRGAVVRVEGNLLRLEETPLDPAVAGLAVVYEGQIMDREERLYSFRLTETPESPLIPDRAREQGYLRVRLTGIFMQVVAYKDRHDPPQYQAAPLIIGRRLDVIEPDASRPAGTPWLWIAALAALAVAITVAMFLNGMRHNRRSRVERSEPTE